MPHRIIRTDDDLSDWVAFARNLKLPLTIEWRQGADRSHDQNRLMWMWAEQAGHQIGEAQTEVQHRWKLHHGVPILRRDSMEFREVYDAVIKPLGYSEKLRAMTVLSVTSEMNVRQMIEFLDTVQRECLTNGIQLSDPDPDLATYHARYRTKETA